MLERAQRPQSPRQLIEKGERRVLEAGDIYFSQKDTALIVSPAGSSLLDSGVRLLPLIEGKLSFTWRKREIRTGMRGYVVRESLKSNSGKIDVALKEIREIHSDSTYWDLTGIQQFQALRVLEEAGIPCAKPLLATAKRLITQWVDQPLVSSNLTVLESDFPVYLEALMARVIELKQNGKWEQKWKVEEQPTNYAIGDLSAEDPLQRFIAIDPAYIYSMFE